MSLSNECCRFHTTVVVITKMFPISHKCCRYHTKKMSLSHKKDVSNHPKDVAIKQKMSFSQIGTQTGYTDVVVITDDDVVVVIR